MALDSGNDVPDEVCFADNLAEFLATDSDLQGFAKKLLLVLGAAFFLTLEVDGYSLSSVLERAGQAVAATLDTGHSEE